MQHHTAELYYANTTRAEGRNERTVIAGDLSSLFSAMDRSCRQKTNTGPE